MELKIYNCKYCNKEFVNIKQLAGHSAHCEHNPNYENILLQLEEARSHIKHNNSNSDIFICKYCGKQVGNAGCLKLHETHCKENPNVILTVRQLQILENKNKHEKRKHLTEEHKQKIREGLCKWKEEHTEEFLSYSRGQSKCCENFKNMLRSKNINFIEEYSPFAPIKLYRLDIAFPDEKIGIEINGSQHYNSDGSLNLYTLEKQKYFEDRGWKIYQIFYKSCYNININDFSDILNLPIHDKEYIQEHFSRKYIKEQEKIKQREYKLKEKLLIDEQRKLIILNLITNSGIDFSKSTWSKQAIQYLEKRGELWNKGIFRCIRKYAPTFLKQNNVWKRKGSKI